MGYAVQGAGLFPHLTIRRNITLLAQLSGWEPRLMDERCDELLEQFKISHIQKTKAGKLSGGERRRLEIARCLVSEPRIIMLDEPFAGIDPVTVQNIQVIIRQLADQGIAILITDHAAREILQTTDRTYVVSEGRILVDGTADQIVRNDQVREKYLGDIDFNKRIRIDSEVAVRGDGVPESAPASTLDPGQAADHGSEPAKGGGQRAKRSRPADVTFVKESMKAEQPRLKQTDLD